MAKYKVVDVPGKNRQGIQVTTYQKQGFSPTVSYSAVRSDGVVSAKGAMTLFIGGTTGDAISNAHRAATNGEAATQPVNPDLVVTEKGAPEVAENPEFTGGVNGTEPATNEVPEYAGGANTVEADKNTQEDYKGGVNGVEPAVRENNPEYTGGVNGVEPAVANPKGEAAVPTETPKTDGVAPAANEVTTDNAAKVPATESKPEQPSSDKPEEPGKPVEAKTGRESSSNPSIFAVFGAVFAALVAGIASMRPKPEVRNDE